MSENYWDDFDDRFVQLDNTEEARREFGYGYGSDHTIITEDDIKALRDGKILAFSDGEYSHFIVYKKA